MTQKLTDLYVKFIRNNYNYDPETGFITRKGGGIKPLGFLNRGYIRVQLTSRDRFYAHQLAFIIKEGYLPEEIDHKDRNRANNKWDNLRVATDSQNNYNRGIASNNTSGYKGVSWDKRLGLWGARLESNYKIYKSFHKTKEEAHAAYCKMAEKYHGEFANV